MQYTSANRIQSEEKMTVVGFLGYVNYTYLTKAEWLQQSNDFEHHCSHLRKKN